MTGQLQQGWEFVWAAYGVVWTGLVLYGTSLLWRQRAENAAPPHPSEEP
jgi:hypothetical protein